MTSGVPSLIAERALADREAMSSHPSRNGFFSGKRKTCRWSLRRQLQFQKVLVAFAVFWALFPAPALSITLPVAMPKPQLSLHPKDFLTVVHDAAAPPEEQAAASKLHAQDKQHGMYGRAASAEDGPSAAAIQEDDVRSHFYKNGRLGSDYRKASTIFMMRLFNDLLRGLPVQLQTTATTPATRPNSTGGQDREGTHDKVPLTDTIRSFSAGNVQLNQKKRPFVTYFVPFLPLNERLRSAEVRFLRHPSAHKRKKYYKLIVNVLRSGKRVEKVVLKEPVVTQRDFDVFDISKVLDAWINTYHGNISLEVKIPRKLEKTIRLQDSSLRSTSLVALYLEDRDFLKNVYESYTTDDIQPSDNSDDEDDTATDRDTTSSSSSGNGTSNSARRKRNPKRRRNLTRNRGKNRRWYRLPKHAKCQIFDFKVDFDFIGWGQWIIHPKHFNAKFCYGECPSPVDAKYKPTNHAMLQTLMRQKKPRLAPPTCCVPIKLKPLSMLYFEYDEIVVRHHENMIVEECGCR